MFFAEKNMNKNEQIAQNTVRQERWIYIKRPALRNYQFLVLLFFQQ